MKSKIRKILETQKTLIKLDVHAVEHCNLNCKGCTHFSSIAEPEYLDPQSLEKSLKRLKRFQKHFWGIQILGGEPLLHPQLSKILDIARKYFQMPKVTIISNGILLLNEKKLPIGFWESCRRNNVLIRITKYPVNIDYCKIEKICQEENVTCEFFRDKGDDNWKFFPIYPKGLEHVTLKYPFLKPLRCKSMNCFQLVGNKIYPCSHVAYVRHLNKRFDLDFKVNRKDYVRVDKLWNILPLKRMFMFSTPFCQYCGYVSKKDTWGPTNEEVTEWIDYGAPIIK